MRRRFFSQSMTREQERELIDRIRTGDERAMDELVAAHTDLIAQSCRPYRHVGVPVADLESEAMRGLMTAARKYAGNGAARFSRFARSYVRQAVLKAIPRLRDVVQIPREEKDRLGLEIVSFDAPVNEQTEETLHEVFADHTTPTPAEELDAAELRTMIENALGRLSLPEQTVVRFYYGFTRTGREHTLPEICQRLSMSKKRARKLLHVAMERLKEELGPYARPALKSKQRLYGQAVKPLNKIAASDG